MAAGDAQSASIDRPLGDSLVVRVTTGDGTPHAGVILDWTVTSGQGSIATATNITDTQGRAAARWTLGPVVGPQTVLAGIRGSATATVSFRASAVAPPPLVLRYDGSTWRTELADSNDVHTQLAAVWGASASEAFALGTCNGTLLHLEVDQWHRVPVGCNVFQATSVSGRSGNDVFLTDYDALPPSASTSVWHYDGQSLKSLYFRECSFCRPRLNGIWTAVGADVFAVGDSGLSVRFDGSSWTPLTVGTTKSLKSVWGAASDHVFAVGDTGTILFFDGTSWNPQKSGVTEALNGLWGRSGSDVFAVGNHGTLLHYDGTTWSSVPSNTTEDLYGVSGSSNQLFVVGNNGTVVLFDGARATARQVPFAIDLRGVWVASSTAAIAVGAPR